MLDKGSVGKRSAPAVTREGYSMLDKQGEAWMCT